MDPYKELGLTPDCSEEDIKKRFKSLAQIFHPDKGGNPEKFLIIKEAYEILIDPNRKKSYDRSGKIKDVVLPRDEALQELAGLLSQHIITLNPENDNLIQIMKQSMIKLRKEIDAKIAHAVSYQIKLKKISKRLLHKSTKENFLDNFLNFQINQLDNEIDSHKESLDVINIMSVILDDYDYIVDNKKLSIDNDSKITIK